MEKFTLQDPLKIDGVEVYELNLRAPKVRDLLIANKKDSSEAEREVKLIANLAEVSAEVIQDLDLRDYVKIQNWLQNFLSVDPEKK